MQFTLTTVYGILGYSILGIRYFNAKSWVILTNFGYKVDHAFSNFGILHEF